MIKCFPLKNICLCEVEFTDEKNYILVRADMLPPIFQKVCEAKEMLARHEAKNASDAAKMLGISRSAFYKYKDGVFRYDEMKSDGITTISLNLIDRAGVLAAVIAKLYEIGANILTINQNIPMNMVAPVTITVKTDETNPEYITRQLSQIDGVVDAETYSRSIL